MPFRSLSSGSRLTWTFLGFLMLGIAVTFANARPSPMDDHVHYQAFIESLAHGSLDLSIPGFHGSDFLAVPWYWLTQSPIAQIEFLIFCAILLPLLAYLVGRDMYGEWEGVVFAGIIAMMPFILFVCLRGWNGAANTALLFLSIILTKRGSLWAGVFFGLALLNKPFAIALLPLLVYLAPAHVSVRRKWLPVLIGLCMTGAYLLLQYLQVGHIIVGSHSELNQANVWQGPVRILLNIAHTFQILFSVHNYYYPDPSLTGPGNMLHTSPLLMMLGIFCIISPRTFSQNEKLSGMLCIGVLIAFGLNALLDHMDHFYMETGVILLILAALPVLRRFPLWIPLVLATLHFQWFYFYLNYRDVFALSYVFFLVPVLLDGLFSLWCVLHPREISAIVRPVLRSWLS